MPKSQAETFVVKVFNEIAIRTLEGEFTDIGVHSVTFKYKKPKSKNFAKRVIPAIDMVAYSGAVGKPSMIQFIDKMVLTKVYKGNVESNGAFIKITQDDGTIINVRSGRNVEVIADTDGPTSSAPTKKKSDDKKSDKKPAKKG